MKQIPELLSPIIVMKSKNFNSRITLFGEVYDGDGLPVMAVLELMPTNQTGTVVLDEIKLTSTHSRKSSNPQKASDITQTQSIINTSDIYYIEPDIKRTNNWLTLNGLQLPVGVTNYGRIKMITYPEQKVNPFKKNNTCSSLSSSLPDNVQSGNTWNPFIKNSSDETAMAEAVRNRSSEGSAETRYSFAGKKAKSADMETLATAERMENDGYTPKEIREKTSWSRGLDGQWRFEIDNSKADFNRKGFNLNPDTLHRKVSDYFNDPELFETYPQMGEVELHFEKMEKDEHGSYDPETNTITLNSFDSAEQNKKTLVHELQHAIQSYEGFTGGSSPEYWQHKIDNGYFRDEKDARTLYQNTAGEIEARDAASRTNMTQEQRRSSFPESMRPNRNVVFASNDINFSKDKSFSEQVHDVLNGTEDEINHVYVGETTSILKQLGLNDKPMLITAGHIKDINHEKVRGVSKYHGLTEEMINKLPYILDYPAIVFDSFSKNNPDAICVLSEMTDNDKLPILVAIKPDGKGKYNTVRIDSNFILSMYGKDNPQDFLNTIGIHHENILYADKKRTQALLRGLRLQLPKSFSKLRFNTIIHKSNNVVKENPKNIQKDSNELLEKANPFLKNETRSSLSSSPPDERQSGNTRNPFIKNSLDENAFPKIRNPFLKK